jgi:hypothetical protein
MSRQSFFLIILFKFQLSMKNILFSAFATLICSFFINHSFAQETVRLQLYWGQERTDNASMAGITEQWARDFNYIDAGTLGYLCKIQQPGTVPLKLYYSEARTDNATLLSQTQEWTKASGYRDAATLGYIFTTQRAGTVPLKLYWGETNADNMTVPEGKDQGAINAGYKMVQILGYIYVNPPSANSSFAAFRHFTNGTNTSGHITTIKNVATDNKPDALLFVTPRNGGASQISPYGVWYNGTKWTIYNQGFQPMSANIDFQVMAYSEANSFVFKQTVTTANLRVNYTLIDHPLCNGKPDAKLMITQNFGSNNVYNNHHVAVWYSTSDQKWSIYNEDKVNMTLGVQFNVLVVSPNDRPVLHTAQAVNIPNTHQNYTYLTNADCDGQANKLVFVTHNWETQGIYINEAINVWYDKVGDPFTDYMDNRWFIYTPDVPQPAPIKGKKFNVVVVNPTQ